MNSGSPNILAINQYYAPDPASSGQLMAQFCEGLVGLGARIRVVAGEPSYFESSPSAPLHEVLNGVEVNRVEMGSALGRARLMTRLRGYYRFMRGARKMSRELAAQEKPDLVLTLSNPPFVGLIGRQISREFEIPFIYDLYDLYPNLLIESGRMRLPWPAPYVWHRMNRRILGSATGVIVLGEVMKRTLIDTYGTSQEKIEVIDHWATPDTPVDPDPALRGELGIPDENLIVAYSGNIGIIHGVAVLLDIAELTADLPITYLIVGQGDAKADLERRVDAKDMKNVRFLGFQPEDRFQSLLATSDICFVSLKRGLERYSVPSKTYTYMAAGKPILCAMVEDSDIARIINRFDCGWTAETASELAGTLRTLISSREEIPQRGAKARTAYLENFTREMAAKNISAFIGSVISGTFGTGSQR